MSEKNGNGDKLSRLAEKVKAAETRLAAEKVLQAKRKQKEQVKLWGDVGREVCRAAEAFPDFKLMLAQTLGGTVTDEKTRRFLDVRGYIA